MSNTASTLAKQLLEAISSDCGWEQLPSTGGTVVQVKSLPDQKSAIKFENVFQHPLSWIAPLFRPEACHTWQHFAEVGAEMRRILAPGDTIIEYCSELAIHKLYNLLGGTTFSHRERVIIRRDFPSPGSISSVRFRLDAANNVLQKDKICASVMSEHEGSRTRRSSFLIFDGRWQWLWPDIVKQTRALWSSMNFSIPDSIHEEAVNAGFMILRMRKICKGPPLVPTVPSCTAPPSTQIVIESITWTAPDEYITLQIYLQTLLRFCNQDPNVIFSSLDGKRVAPFQAVVQRSSWPGLWNVLEPLLGQHRSVYRLKYGGTGAPSLSIDVPPIFEYDAGTSDSEDSESSQE
eukprot:TRINITY_DN8442_c0_g1_i1.p1 TRINITY_DN8442_c0_g1~~TRINITY_DN8442_c0_g1_i1.p1  ORF type:complete len:367 (+),score=31.27 TRINITY_DN8442_c0_g1_i1:60-1103(+)